MRIGGSEARVWVMGGSVSEGVDWGAEVRGVIEAGIWRGKGLERGRGAAGFWRGQGAGEFDEARAFFLRPVYELNRIL
jgi:hypothetical protein